MPKQNGECPECGGLGWYSYNLPVGHPNYGRMFPCECQSPLRAAMLQSICGLNESERALRLDDIVPGNGHTERMVTACRAFVEARRGILTIWGTSGNAKTTAMQAVVNELVGQNVMAIYITMYDLVHYVREAFNDGTDSAWARVRRFQDVRILCIDEFDKVKESEWYDELRTSIIDKRYRDAVAGLTGTMLAMNSDPIKLPSWIYSRLRDGRNKVIYNGDADMREYLL